MNDQIIQVEGYKYKTACPICNKDIPVYNTPLEFQVVICDECKETMAKMKELIKCQNF